MPTAWSPEFADMQTQPVTTELLALQVDDGGLSLKQLWQIGNSNKHCNRLSLPEHRLRLPESRLQVHRRKDREARRQAEGQTNGQTDRQMHTYVSRQTRLI